MRAFVVTGPGKAEVQTVDEPVAGPGEVVVDVERAGVCGTDLEFFSGEMAYLLHSPDDRAGALGLWRSRTWPGTAGWASPAGPS